MDNQTEENKAGQEPGSSTARSSNDCLAKLRGYADGTIPIPSDEQLAKCHVIDKLPLTMDDFFLGRTDEFEPYKEE